MNSCELAKYSLSKCPTQQTLKSSESLSSPVIVSPFTIIQKKHLPSFQRPHSHRKKIFDSKGKATTRHSGLKQMRSISNHTNKMLRGEILEGIKKKSEEKKRRDSKKKFPQNMKIVYYGPIGKSPLKFQSKGKLETPRKVVSSQEIEIIKPKQMELNSIVKDLETKSRYYDINSTKVSEGENKKMSVTYYPIVKEQQKSVLEEKGRKWSGELLIYVLLGIVGIILLLKIIVT